MEKQKTARKPVRFLGPEATPAQLIRASAANHISHFTANASASGGEVRLEEGVPWIITPGANGEVIIAFPNIASQSASRVLDTILAETRRQNINRASCWALTPTRPRDLGARLAARGFEWGWQPHWMGLDLQNMPTDYSVPDGLQIQLDDESDWDVGDLPYYSRQDSERLQMQAQLKPRCIWHFGAWLDGKIVGHSLLHLTTGVRGVAGIYNIGVVPDARNRGIGRAVTLAACRFAQELGCHWATLNAAVPELYLKCGFVSLGWGQTWWMHPQMFAAPPPTAQEIAFAEAIGRGDIRALDALAEAGTLPESLDGPLTNQMLPMALAIQSGKPASAQWLLEHGTTLNVIDAWDLGWQEQAAALLAEQPDRVNQSYGPLNLTPMHVAVNRGDLALARFLLAAGPDLTLCDPNYDGTPLGWAHHLGKVAMVALIEEHLARK